MTWRDALEATLRSLASERPAFHSEADLQHALAVHMRDRGFQRVRLERPHPLAGRIDLTAVLDDVAGAVEVKYWKRAAKFEVEGETYHLKNRGAQDLGRYDFWKDVHRIESLVDTGAYRFGAVIALTNEPSYWRSGSSSSIDAAFRMEDGRIAPRSMSWARASATSKDRSSILAFSRDHRCSWNDYASPSGQTFRWCGIHIDPPVNG